MIADDLAKGPQVTVSAGEALRHLHVPVAVADLLHDTIERAIGKDEDVCLIHGGSSIWTAQVSQQGIAARRTDLEIQSSGLSRADNTPGVRVDSG